MRTARERNTTEYRTGRRLAAALCAVLLAMSSCAMLLAVPSPASAETAGETLIVRVQYFGERGDMIREKARFSRGELESMGARTWYYSCVTNVGTVMSMAARGPEVLTIIERAGIDPGSISNITFRTTDGYTRNFTVERHLSGGRYYYPHLNAGYDRSEDGRSLMPPEGSLADAQEVPAILALESGATKEPGVEAESLDMSTDRSYRFCMGQSPLTEGQWSRPGESGDVSSMDSVHSIYGIDVTLSGSPVSGIGIDPVKGNLKVGSVTKMTIHVEGDSLFAEDYDNALGDLTWSSSDPSIAKVDRNGNVTILKAGTVTITVQAANGMSASITINGTGKGKNSKSKSSVKPTGSSQSATRSIQKATAAGTTSPSSSTQKKVRVREITLGDEVRETPREQEEARALAEGSAALEENRKHDPGAAAGAAGTALAACGIGGIHRFRRVRSIYRGWKR